VTAVGIETQQQFDFCRKNGCETLQGYYFSLPLDAVTFESKYFNGLDH
jgi:EAL domain-containing protein (putative c-di-GMP-specific phosphodiesterase class I)